MNPFLVHLCVHTHSRIYPSFCVDNAITYHYFTLYLLYFLLQPYTASSITANHISFFAVQCTVTESTTECSEPKVSLDLRLPSSSSASKTMKLLGSPCLPKESRIESEGVWMCCYFLGDFKNNTHLHTGKEVSKETHVESQ